MKHEKILVVGGAGYIGSHMLILLKQAGYIPIVLDNLSKGHLSCLDDVEFVQGDIADRACLEFIFAKHQFTAVMHFASLIEVAESVIKPNLYYQNNVAALMNLLNVMCAYHVTNFIFSSSAAVYGNPDSSYIAECHPLEPVNPYGRSKRMAEEIVKDYAAAGKLKYGIFRYFNAAGADPDGRTGELHIPESHLIPLALQVAAGHKEYLTIYGDDYPTKDGSCVRDYVHVSDICHAHLLALQALAEGTGNFILNLGSGCGYSVKQVVASVQRVTSVSISTVIGRRRAGDPPILVADARLAKQELGWKPIYSDLDTIILHAWRFYQKVMARDGGVVQFAMT